MFNGIDSQKVFLNPHTDFNYRIVFFLSNAMLPLGPNNIKYLFTVLNLEISPANVNLLKSFIYGR